MLEVGTPVSPAPEPENTPVALTDARTVPELFSHCCKFAVWEAAPLTTSALSPAASFSIET